MNPSKMLQGLAFLSEITAKKQTYYVYQSKSEYVLLTVSSWRPNSYNISVVPIEAAEYIEKSFKGRKQFTGKEVLDESKKPALLKTRFDALNSLYALCAKGSARIDHRHKQKALFFSIK